MLELVDWPLVESVEAVPHGGRGLKRIPVDLGDGGRADLWLYVVRGAADGPTFYFLGGQHGREINSCGAIDAYVNRLDPESLRGTVLALPVANPISTADDTQYPTFPEGVQNNMNLIWPGRTDGNWLERLCRAAFDHGMATCDYLLDIHSWKRYQAPGALFSNDLPEMEALGRAAGLRFAYIRERRGFPGYSTAAVRDAGGLGFCIELSGQGRIFPDQVEEGCRVMTNLLRHADMLEGEVAVPRLINMEGATPVEPTAPADALLQPVITLGDPVTAGQPIARLLRFDTGRSELLCSPVDGAVWSMGAVGRHRSHHRDEPHYESDVSSPVEAGEVIAVIYEWQD